MIADRLVDRMCPKIWEINTEENAVDYLERAAEFFVSSVDHKWKWVIISLHAALYSFAVCAVRGTDPSKVERKDGKLISVREALKRCQDTVYMLQYSNSKVLELSSDEKWAINKLSSEFRNCFEHFSPKLWAIEVSGMPQIIKYVTRVIEFLSLESGNVTLRLTNDQRCRLGKAIETLKS